MNKCFFIFGFGYTAKALASKLLIQGFNIVGTSRTPDEQHSKFSDVKLIDFNYPKIDEYLNIVTHILVCIPPISSLGDLVFMQYRDLIKKQAPHLQWLGYLSSTGVYGDYQGNWVDEESECRANTPTAVARLQTEKSWLSYASQNKLPLHVFRLSGIYGPGRNALERCMQKKYSIFKENQVFCRIHIDDIVATLIASIKAPNPIAIYNVSDDEPAPVHVVDAYAASLMQREPLPCIDFKNANLSVMEQEFYANNRRVSNFKIKKELNITLQYPTYKEGLKACNATIK